MSDHDFAREPGLGEQKDCKLGEMPLPVCPNSYAQFLLGAKRSCSTDFPTAAPPTKKINVNEMEIQTSETIETLGRRRNIDKSYTLNWNSINDSPGTT